MPELWWEFEAAKERDKDRSGQQIVQAWQVVRIWMKSHQKDHSLRLPSLKALLDELDAPKVQTPQDHLSVLRTLSKQYGIPLRTETRH